MPDTASPPGKHVAVAAAEAAAAVGTDRRRRNTSNDGDKYKNFSVNSSPAAAPAHAANTHQDKSKDASAVNGAYMQEVISELSFALENPYGYASVHLNVPDLRQQQPSGRLSNHSYSVPPKYSNQHNNANGSSKWCLAPPVARSVRFVGEPIREDSCIHPQHRTAAARFAGAATPGSQAAAARNGADWSCSECRYTIESRFKRLQQLCSRIKTELKHQTADAVPGGAPYWTSDAAEKRQSAAPQPAVNSLPASSINAKISKALETAFNNSSRSIAPHSRQSLKDNRSQQVTGANSASTEGAEGAPAQKDVKVKV